MNISDLKTGYRIVLRNNSWFVWVSEKQMGFDDERNYIGGFNHDLTSDLMDDFDIMEVYDHNRTQFPSCFLDPYSCGALIWKRKEMKVKEDLLSVIENKVEELNNLIKLLKQ